MGDRRRLQPIPAASPPVPGRSCRAHGESSRLSLSPSLPLTKKTQENLKILRQYAKLLTQACHKHATADLAAHVQPLSPNPTTYPRNLQWFEALARPYQPADTQSRARVEQLLQLFEASCHKSENHSDRRPLAYDLAKTLPHFDRDLTAYYLSLPDDTSLREYHLCVAHSIMRLHDPPDLAGLKQHLATWRNQGLLHVLSLAAMHMPDLADWFHPPLDKDEEAHSLVLTLEALRMQPRDYAQTISDFIATQDPATPTAQAIATTLDRLAILMSVKSDADVEPQHDLAQALAAFPCLDALEPHDLWCRLQTDLVRSLPPSLLRVDPVCAKKRVRQARGTW